MNARRLLLGTVAAAAAAAVLTGCAAGQVAETARETQVADANSAQSGDIALRGVKIAAPTLNYQQGSTAPLELIVVNTATGTDATDDTLTAVSSSIAAGVSLMPATSASSGAATPTYSLGPSASTPAPSTSTTSSASAGSSAAASALSVAVAKGTAVSLGNGADAMTLVLTGLKQTIYPGQSFPVTFTFAKAGAITLDVPVELNADSTVSPSYVPGVTGDYRPSDVESS